MGPALGIYKDDCGKVDGSLTDDSTPQGGPLKSLVASADCVQQEKAKRDSAKHSTCNSPTLH
jgi:hypothetical protein